MRKSLAMNPWCTLDKSINSDPEFVIDETMTLNLKLRLLLSFITVKTQQLHDSVIILLRQFVGSQYTTEGMNNSSSQLRSRCLTWFLAFGRCSLIFVK